MLLINLDCVCNAHFRICLRKLSSSFKFGLGMFVNISTRDRLGVGGDIGIKNLNSLTPKQGLMFVTYFWRLD